MKTAALRDEKIIESWEKNAAAWVTAVRGGQIASRRQATDHAILDAVVSNTPRSVLDIGCGEGWLARALAAKNIHVIGIDVIPDLVAEAQRAGGGDFRVVSYEELAAGTFSASVDVVVSNFAFLGDESVSGVFKATSSLLNPGGSFIVQTLHPVIACGDLPYQDGWREGSWAGFSSDFTDPAPWYFRTLESWTTLFVTSGFRLREIREPIHPMTRKPASVIFIAEALR